MRPGTALALTPQVIQVIQAGEEGNQQVKTVPSRPGVLKVKTFQGDQSIGQHLTSRRSKEKLKVEVFFWECCWIWDLLKDFGGMICRSYP